MATRIPRPEAHTGVGHRARAEPCRTESRIVVGVDGSPSSIEAVRWAARHCQVIGAHLQAVMSWSPGTVESSPVGREDDPAADARDMVSISLDHALGARAGTVEVRVAQGPPGEVLLDAGAGANMLVVGSSEHARKDRFISDSVGDHLVAHSFVPRGDRALRASEVPSRSGRRRRPVGVLGVHSLAGPPMNLSGRDQQTLEHLERELLRPHSAVRLFTHPFCPTCPTAARPRVVAGSIAAAAGERKDLR